MENFGELVNKELKKIRRLIAEGSFQKAKDLIRNSLLLTDEQKTQLLKEIKEANSTASQLNILIQQNEELKNQLQELTHGNAELKGRISALEKKLDRLEKKLAVQEKRSAKWTHLGNFLALFGLIVTLAPIIVKSFEKIIDLLEIISKAISKIIEFLGSK